MKKTTRTTLQFEDGKRNFRLLFGDPVKIETVSFQLGVTTQHAYFRPDSIFALDLWERNEYGTKEWRIYIVRAVWPGERAARIPQVEPGGEVLLYARGKNRVQKVLSWLREIEKAGEMPAHLHPDLYRAAHVRFLVNLEPRRINEPCGRLADFLKEREHETYHR